MVILSWRLLRDIDRSSLCSSEIQRQFLISATEIAAVPAGLLELEQINIEFLLSSRQNLWFWIGRRHLWCRIWILRSPVQYWASAALVTAISWTLFNAVSTNQASSLIFISSKVARGSNHRHLCALSSLQELIKEFIWNIVWSRRVQCCCQTLFRSLGWDWFLSWDHFDFYKNKRN